MQENREVLLRKLTPYLFLLPALFLLSITVIYPALQGFYLSFTRYEYDLTQAPEWVGLTNFQRLWVDPLFWQTLRQTLLYLVVVVPILVVLPLGLAILVDRKMRGILWFRTAYYTPVVISMVVAGIAWKWLYSENGILDRFVRLFGFDSGIPWLTSPKLAIFSVMAVTVWKGLGYYMVIYLAGLQGIPAQLYEAAALDGSDGWRRHLDITVPLMQPYLLLVAVISSLSATKVFEEVFVMTQGGPRNSSQTIVYYLYEQAFSYLEMSYACAIGLVLFLLVLGLSVLNLKLSSRAQ
ncbi:MAG: sugar ABC transporter permease [Cyanobacteriota bacterium]|nr:sugar ABC transporter permease [Cyanobacteriota bacterium]